MLRERLGLLGAKGACEQGECGSCSVLVDGELVCSCLVLAASAVDQPIVTVEGLAEPGAPTDVQRAFVDAGAVQCGFCTPGPDHGRARPARAPPATRPSTEIREELSGNICRCTGYGRIIDAVQQVAADRAGDVVTLDATTDVAAGRRPAPAGSATRPARPDGIAKVQGSFAFSSDLPIDGALWGATLRSPHPYARIVSIDVSPAWRIPGVEAVITADDVPGKATYGLIAADQPVFAGDVVRYVGEPVAAVAADHPETCRRALAAIDVDYEVLEPLLDPEAAIDGTHPPIHPDGNVLRHQRIVRGDVDATGDVVVEGTYEIGMQDQAFLGLEAALAVPDPDGGGVELHIATQWLHEDRKQIAACLGLPEDAGAARARRRRRRVRRPRGHQPAGPHLPAGAAPRAGRCAWPTAGPRASSATCTATRRRSGCATTPPRDGELVKIEARFVLDGGAYASTSSAVLLNAITHAQGPYRCPNAVVDGWAVRTNHLPCGAMRGFGVVQACFAHEGQMDRLAAACGLDPVEIRLRNAMGTGDRLITGQVVESVAPVARCIRETAALPLPDTPIGVAADAGDRRPDAPARRRRAAPPTSATCAAASAGAWRSRT